MLAFLALLLTGSQAYLAPVGDMNVSTSLANFIHPVRVIFFDFDKTITVTSTRDTILPLCGYSCATYTPNSTCPCNGTTTALGDFVLADLSSKVLAEPDVVFNGTDRRDRLAQTFQLIRSKGVQLKVLSVAGYFQSAANWQFYLHTVFDIANLTQYIPLEDILTLDDPGLNISADKGSVMQDYLNNNSWGPHNGLFIDDTSANIATADGKIDWLVVTPQTGLAENQLQYIETRASQTFGFVCTCPFGVPTGLVPQPQSDATRCEINNTVDCSACNDGYRLSAVAGTGLQHCAPANCSALPQLSVGGANTCTSNLVTGDNCTISCPAGYSVLGGANQYCVASGPGVSTFQNSQVCNGAQCTALSVTFGSAGTCNSSGSTGDNCSITCDDGYVVSGPATQRCVGTGPGTSVYENSQTCVAVQCATLAPAFGSANTCTNSSTTDNCTITCDDGYVLSGPASQWCVGTGPGTSAFEDSQTCVAAQCTALSPAFGSTNTCNNSKATGDNCSISCNSGYVLTGPANQYCAATGPGTSAFDDSQTCVAATCATPVVVNGTAGTCVNKTTGQNCSITCNSGHIAAGPSVQTCSPAGPGTSNFPNPQSCNAPLPAPSCPTADLALFFSQCLDSDIAGACRIPCDTSASWLSAAFKKIAGPQSFVDACIRANSTLTIANVEYVIAQVNAGHKVCRSVSSASQLKPLLAVLFSSLVSFILVV